MDGYRFDAELMREAVAAAERHWEYLHDIPEPAFSEYKTTEYIRRTAMQYPVTVIDHGMDTGFVCWLDAGADRTVALRADIDALPTEDGPGHGSLPHKCMDPEYMKTAVPVLCASVIAADI